MNTISKTTKLIAVLVLLLLTFLFYLYHRHNNNILQKAKDYKTLYYKEQKATQIWKDEANKWRLQTDATEISQKTLKELARNNDKYFSDIRNEFTNIKSNMRNMDTYIKTVFKDTLIITTVLTDTAWINSSGDTVKGKRGIYKDDWSNCVGLVYNDTLKVNCVNTDTITSVIYWNRKWFLGRKKYTLENKNANPNNKPIYNDNIIVRKKR